MTTTITIPADKSVLVVEDNEFRLEWFREYLAGLKFTTCITPQKALNVLGVHQFDIVFLDHDAVPFFIDETDPDFHTKTFFRVAELLEKINYQGMVVIHSHNSVGANRMYHLLQRNNPHVHILPFGDFKIVRACARE